MGNIARVFLRDARRLAHTPATWAVVLCLILEKPLHKQLYTE